jgi:ABC-type multidrug transport system fused ATPase/permease subunit
MRKSWPLRTVARWQRPSSERVRFAYTNLAPYGRPHRKWLALGSIGALAVVLARLAFPWPLRGILELVVPGGDQSVVALLPAWGDPFWWLAGIFFMLALGQGFGEYVQRVSFARFAVGTVHDARAAKVQLLISKAHRVVESHPTGDVIARVIGDSARLKAGIKGVLVHVTQNGIFLAGVAAILFLVDLQLGTIFLVGLLAAFAVAFHGASRLSKVARRYRAKEGALAEGVHRALAVSPVGSEQRLTTRARTIQLQSDNLKSGRRDVRITRIQTQTTWIIHVVMALVAFAILQSAVAGVIEGRLLVGDLFTAVAYLLLAHNPMVQLGRQTARLGKILASAERLAAVRAPPKIRPMPGPRAAGSKVS